MSAHICDWYLITCLTHLHAGRGDTNYDIVDKEVQRDPIDDLPVIHASSLKGALREWFRHQLPGVKSQDHATISQIFGNDTKRGNSADFGQGSHQFFEARLLALPVRSSHMPYFLATSPNVLTDCLDQLMLFGIDYPSANAIRAVLEKLTPKLKPGIPLALYPAVDELYLDEYKAHTDATPVDVLRTLLGYDHIALFHHDDLKDVAGRLPVIARNNLENGRSVNLWYEEIVPRQTRFSFFTRHAVDTMVFADTLAAGGWRVQIGANATIGYGQCSLSRPLGQ